MLKSFLHVCMALMLSLSVLAPAVMDVFDFEIAIEVADNLGDEDSKKESKKEIEEKEFFYEDLATTSLLNVLDEKQHQHFYMSQPYLLATDIFLPPPEFY